jgi:hypothetical protein
LTHFLTVSQVRVVTLLPNIFSVTVMNTAPRDHREIKQASSAARRPVQSLVRRRH